MKNEKRKSVIIFIVLLLISYWNIRFSKIRFSTADDYLLNNIISGALGNTFDSQLLYINNLLGVILKIIYQLIPFINIYMWYLVIILCLCFTQIIKQIEPSKNYALLAVMFILYLVTLYNITYTILAYLSVGIGCLEILENKKKIPWTSYFFIINGYLLRNQVIFPVGIVLGILILVQLVKEKDKRRIKNIIILVMVIILLNIGGNLFYQTNPILSDFKKWQEASISLRDYEPIQYKDYSQVLQEQNWSENDLKLFYTWNFADKEKFSEESMKIISSSVKLSDKYNLNLKNVLLNWIKQYINTGNFLDDIYILFFVVLFILSILKCDQKKQIIYVGIATIGIHVMLIVRNRYPYRVVYPQYLIAIAYFIYKIAGIKKDVTQKRKKTIAVGIVSFAISILFAGIYGNQYFSKILSYEETCQISNELMKQIENQDSLYIVESSKYNELTMNYPILERKKIGQYKNLIKSGGGDCFSKRYYECIQNFGLEYSDNLYKNLTKENIYYIGENNDILETYFKENVSETGYFTEVERIQTIPIYQFQEP